MNIYQKLVKARLALVRCEITKSGFNKHSNYAYYELTDYMPSILAINDEVGICPIVSFEEDIAVLTIYNTEKTEESIRFTFKLKEITLPACNAMQSEGGKHTYARRYLYIDAYEISEVDPNEVPEASKHNEKTQSDLDKEIIDSIASLKKNCALAGFTIQSVIDRYNVDNKKNITTLEEIPVKMLVGFDQMMLITIKKNNQKKV